MNHFLVSFRLEEKNMTFLFRLWICRDLKHGMYEVSRLCYALCFKSGLCFSTFCDFWQLFLPLPSFFSLLARLCQTMSYMQGYTLSGQGLRAYKVNGPWLKQLWSCSRMEKTGAAECGQGCCSCDVNLCPENVWAESADDKQRWKIHWALICFNIRLHNPGHNLTSGGVWKVSILAELPY